MKIFSNVSISKGVSRISGISHIQLYTYLYDKNECHKPRYGMIQSENDFSF